ncbi:hypothetical protein [Tepidibacillus marianensis]|uniref:hypothetical protein n=1 Tax=Tepidibacillus marianensis TaxID=3131995 RepID=UPI0030CD8A8A
MNEIICEGPFKDHIQNHVELKRAVGYKYDTDQLLLDCLCKKTEYFFAWKRILIKNEVFSLQRRLKHDEKEDTTLIKKMGIFPT